MKKKYVLTGREVLGIEFGSTRIKAVLIDQSKNVIATGSYEWENVLKNGLWTYSRDSIITGLQVAYSNLNNYCYENYGSYITNLSSMGISAMMHGLIALDEDGNFLTDFRTWRNNNTSVAANKLCELFNFNIPERWSIAHLYQCILDKEDFIPKISYITTLAGYIHYLLTGLKCLSIGDASGMFPIDSKSLNYDMNMINIFENILEVKEYGINLVDILPEVKCAGEVSGTLTDDGVKILDVSGNLVSGVKLCPAEGDAGTGMVATNSIAPRTCNVSAGTSVFLMAVLERPLTKYDRAIDIVSTPDGYDVAMVHCNNCSTFLNTIFNVFREFYYEFSGTKLSNDELYPKMFSLALKGDSDCGNLIVYPYISGEQVAMIDYAKPIILSGDNTKFTLANLARSLIYSCFATLKIGMDKLYKENVKIDIVNAHGGLFKSEDIAQRFLALFLESNTSVSKTASEGGAYGIALLADYLNYSNKMSLADYLNNVVFSKSDVITVSPSLNDLEGVKEYFDLFKNNLEVEKALSNKKFMEYNTYLDTKLGLRRFVGKGYLNSIVFDSNDLDSYIDSILSKLDGDCNYTLFNKSALTKYINYMSNNIVSDIENGLYEDFVIKKYNDDLFVINFDNNCNM